MKNIFCFIAVICLAASCSSMKVASKMYSGNLEPVDARDVLVCENGAGVPDSAVKIGEFSVYDDGLAKTEPFETTLERVKEDAGNNGANVINILEHIEPGFSTGSNHQFSGDYLFAPDFTVTEGNAFAQAYTMYEEAKEAKEAQRFTGGSLRAGVGVAIVPTKFDFSESTLKADPASLRIGLAYEISYDYITKRNFSFGLVGTCYRGSSAAKLDGYYGTFSLGMGVWAPTIGYCRSTDKFIARAVFGLGYGSYSESFKTGSTQAGGNEGGIGLTYAADFLYRITPSTSVGLSLEDNEVAIMGADIKGTVQWYTISLSLRRSF